MNRALPRPTWLQPGRMHLARAPGCKVGLSCFIISGRSFALREAAGSFPIQRTGRHSGERRNPSCERGTGPRIGIRGDGLQRRPRCSKLGHWQTASQVGAYQSVFCNKYLAENRLNMKIRHALWPVVLAFMLFLDGTASPLLAQDIETAISAGKQGIESGRPDEALELFSRLIANDPQAVLYYYRGLAYSAKNQESLAVQDFTRAISLQPLRAAYYLRRGASLLRTSQYQQAIDDFTKVMELEPENPYARGRRARGLFYLGQTQKAIDDLLQAIRLNPDNAALYRPGVISIWPREIMRDL